MSYFTLHSSCVLRYYVDENGDVPQGNVDVTQVKRIIAYEKDPEHPNRYLNLLGVWSRGHLYMCAKFQGTLT